MTATASLEDYIKQFKQDYKKYLSNDTSSVNSSIDTAELLSDMSSETSSIPARSAPKSSIKSISSLKKRNKLAKVHPPVHMKPLHSTPLKMIQEEDEFAESKYKLSDYLPSQQFDINEYLPKARAAKNQRVNEILASLDVESENMSIISSVDTEALLQSSDEEEEMEKLKRKQKIDVRSKKVENLPRVPEKLTPSSKVPTLSIGTTSVLNLLPNKLTIQKFSMLVHKSKPSAHVKPSQVFNTLRPQPSLHPLRICSCILSGSLYSHFPSCRQLTVLSTVAQTSPPKAKKFKTFLQSVIFIQKAIRSFLQSRQTRQTKKIPSVFPIPQGSSTLSHAYQQLEALRSLASEQSSEVSLDNIDYDKCSIDTESLLNSSFSSILSKNY